MTITEPIIKLYGAKLQEIQVDILYRILIQRIAKHYSTEEVSFLMGKSLIFASNIENLKTKDILAIDLITMKKALEIRNMDNMFHLSPEFGIKRVNYQLTKTMFPDRTIYHMEKVNAAEKSSTTVFFLQDINHALDLHPQSALKEIEMINNTIDTLIKNDYFDKARTPFEIFTKCSDIISEHIKPQNLYKVLTSLTKEKEYPKLQYKKSKELGYYYIKVDKQ